MRWQWHLDSTARRHWQRGRNAPVTDLLSHVSSSRPWKVRRLQLNSNVRVNSTQYLELLD